MDEDDAWSAEIKGLLAPRIRTRWPWTRTSPSGCWPVTFARTRRHLGTPRWPSCWRDGRHLTVEGLVEFRGNQHKGRVEVLVDGRYDHGALDALVAGIPRDAYEVLETAGAGEGSGVSPARLLRRLGGRLGRFRRTSAP